VASQQPACVICGAPCIHGQPTMSLDGALAHVNCYAAREHVTQRIAAFLNQGPERSYCNVCIAAACSLPYQAVAGVVAHLRWRCDVQFVIGGHCALCGSHRITIGVGPSRKVVPRSSGGRLDTGEAPPRDATELVADFLRQRPDRSYCHVCLRYMCSLAHQDVAKATTRLRTQPDFQMLLGARCTWCDKLRVTFGVRVGPPETAL